MFRKDNVEVLSFFRASDIRGGPFIEFELLFPPIPIPVSHNHTNSNEW